MGVDLDAAIHAIVSADRAVAVCQSQLLSRSVRCRQVWEQLRRVFFTGIPSRRGNKGRGSGWKPANCANLVRHAIGEMNAWIEKYGGRKLTGTVGNLAVVDLNKDQGKANTRG